MSQYIMRGKEKGWNQAFTREVNERRKSNQQRGEGTDRGAMHGQQRACRELNEASQERQGQAAQEENSKRLRTEKGDHRTIPIGQPGVGRTQPGTE